MYHNKKSSNMPPHWLFIGVCLALSSIPTSCDKSVTKRTKFNLPSPHANATVSDKNTGCKQNSKKFPGPINNGSVLSCRRLQPGPPLVQNATSRRHQVLFPLKISDALDALLQATITKKLKGKSSKRTAKSSSHKGPLKLMHPKLYLAGDVQTPKRKKGR